MESALAAGDFNHDGFVDLAAGAPGRTSSASAGRGGAVSVLPGSATGLTATGGPVGHPGWGRGGGRATSSGSTLAAGDLNGRLCRPGRWRPQRACRYHPRLRVR